MPNGSFFGITVNFVLQELILENCSVFMTVSLVRENLRELREIKKYIIRTPDESLTSNENSNNSSLNNLDNDNSEIRMKSGSISR